MRVKAGECAEFEVGACDAKGRVCLFPLSADGSDQTSWRLPVPADQPLVVISKSGSKRWLSATDSSAPKLGLRVGMPASKAQAMVTNLAMIDANPVEDAVALKRLALWSLRQYSPVVAVDGTDGIVIDTEGADYLQGGEARLISGLVNMLHARGLTAQAAVADTWGSAHAIARLSVAATTVVPIYPLCASSSRNRDRTAVVRSKSRCPGRA